MPYFLRGEVTLNGVSDHKAEDVAGAGLIRNEVRREGENAKPSE